MSRAPLDPAEIERRLAQAPGWSLDGGKLYREFRFPDFVAAFGFMARCALAAGQLDRHPERANVYGTVRVHLTTHDAGGLTARDFELAARMDALAR